MSALEVTESDVTHGQTASLELVILFIVGGLDIVQWSICLIFCIPVPFINMMVKLLPEQVIIPYVLI